MTIDFAYMNPITMKSSNISLGDRLLIKNGTSVICCTSWPSGQVELGQVALNRQYLGLNGFSFDQLLVQKMRKEEIKQADQVVIEQVESACRLDESQDEDVQLILEFLRERYLNKIVTGSQYLHLAYMGQQLVFKIASVISKKKKKSQVNDISKKLESLNLNGVHENSEFYAISQSTSFKLATSVGKEDTKKEIESANRRVTFKDIGGMEKEIELVKEIFIDTFKFSAQYDELGIEFSKGVLLYGPKGCGKTLLARAILHESQCHFIELNVTEIYSKNYGESETKLKQVFDKAFQK